MHGRNRASPSGRVGSSPRTRTLPAVGLPMPMQHSRVVVFPAPFRPSSPKTVPRGTEKLIPATASTVPYRFTSPSTTIASLTVTVFAFAAEPGL